jgi:hypothetical protein
MSFDFDMPADWGCALPPVNRAGEDALYGSTESMLEIERWFQVEHPELLAAAAAPTAAATAPPKREHRDAAFCAAPAAALPYHVLVDHTNVAGGTKVRRRCAEHCVWC